MLRTECNPPATRAPKIEPMLMIEPGDECAMRRCANAWATRNGPRRLVPMTLSQSARRSVERRFDEVMPALLRNVGNAHLLFGRKETAFDALRIRDVHTNRQRFAAALLDRGDNLCQFLLAPRRDDDVRARRGQHAGKVHPIPLEPPVTNAVLPRRSQVKETCAFESIPMSLRAHALLAS